jgi:hypothetical protein
MLGHLISEFVIFELLDLVRTYAWYCVVIIELLLRVVLMMTIYSYYFSYDCSHLVLQIAMASSDPELDLEFLTKRKDNVEVP